MKTLTLKKNYLFKTLFVLIIVISASSCKKKDIIETLPTVKDLKVVPSISTESLIKFLSITLDVKKSEIAFNPIDDEFIIRGQLKFTRNEIESNYKNANVYQAINEN